MSRDFDRMFDHVSPWRLSLRPWFERSIPVQTTKDGKRMYKIELDLQDFEPEHIRVSVMDREVTIKAKRETETDGCKQLREYSYQYTLPAEVNPAEIRSLFNDNGILSIEAPLPEIEKPPVKEIPVEHSKSENNKK